MGSIYLNITSDTNLLFAEGTEYSSCVCRLKTTESSVSLSPVVEKCKIKIEKEPGQKQKNEQAKKLGEYLNFRK